MSPAPARVDELKKRYEENPRRFFAPLANEYRKAGDLDAAIDLCRMHLEEQPGHLSGHIVYGQALYESHRADEAKKVFEAALTLDPENLIALRHLGDIAKSEGDATAATHWYQRVLDADPRNDEVIALIESLKRAPVESTVTISEPTAPPPVPQYATDTPPAVAAAAASAPTPVIATPVVAPPPMMRPSIGLMDLDLNLADSTAPTVDFLPEPQAQPSAAEPPAAPPEPLMPLLEEPAPEFEEGFPLADELLPTAAGATPELLGVDDTNLGLAGPDETVAVHDTSFGADLTGAEAPTFAAAKEESAFGDSLDVIMPEEPTATPSAAAEPAAPSPGDFDMLFGNAPIADVQIGGDAGAAQPADAGFTADSFIGREPSGETLGAAPDIATPPSPFVTETMAELYLQQGFRDEALGVYRQLLAQNPDDLGLAERIRHLEHGSRSSLAIDNVSAEIEAAAEADELRRSGSVPLIPLEPIVEPDTVPSAIVPMPEEAVPAFMVQAPEPVAAPEPEPEPVTAPAAVFQATGPSAREVFSRIANRRAVPGGGFAAEPIAEYAPAEYENGSVAAAAPAPRDEAAPVSPGGTLDQLFGMGGVVAVDEGVAVSMASAFGGAAPAPIKGEPTRAGTDELSLDSVFKADAAPARPMGVERQSTKLRFDQFFAGVDDAPASPSGHAAPATPALGQGEDDVAQFSDWLKGLKGT